MRSPITSIFRDLDRSGALEDRARKLGTGLERYNERITQRHMMLVGPDKCSDTQAPYLRDAFNNAKRQLQELQRDRSEPASMVRLRS